MISRGFMKLGLQFYRATEAGDPTAIERARRTLMNTMEMTMHSPFLPDMGGPEEEESMMAIHYLFRNLERFLSSPKLRRKSSSQSEEKKP